MVVQIAKAVALGAFGWLLYRSVIPRVEPVDERPEGRPEDLEAGPEPTAAPEKDNLRRVRGIGPGIENVLNARGITTWTQLAVTEVADLREILDQAGPRYRSHDPSTWPGQAAELAAAN